ncbi:neutral zinc metallopeptidase [Hankyongella ginsenosidimutans]|uniref:neutral zinc metallopeptidase n=1 Tax=Hankyongella ginsenosidimutans TaxID=1763828 RepID=UPI001FE78504|nr:neutral zinc metallopeptidase [Hankyongella ginsenosidimutans]
MKWRNARQSDNIEDRRGQPGRRMAGLPLGGKGGLLGLVVIIGISMLLGVNPLQVLSGLEGAASQDVAAPRSTRRRSSRRSNSPPACWGHGRCLGSDPAELPARNPRALPGADTDRLRSGRGIGRPSTAPATGRCIWICHSSKNCKAASARRAILPPPTSSPTKSATMSRP